MKIAELETLLSADDVAKGPQLLCLSCRRRLASLTVSERPGEDGTAAQSQAVSSLSADLRDYHQTREAISLVCGCSIRSIYHLL